MNDLLWRSLVDNHADQELLTAKLKANLEYKTLPAGRFSAEPCTRSADLQMLGNSGHNDSCLPGMQVKSSNRCFLVQMQVWGQQRACC